MEKILIENYEGFEIYFNKETNEFECVYDGDNKITDDNFEDLKIFLKKYTRVLDPNSLYITYHPYWSTNCLTKIKVKKVNPDNTIIIDNGHDEANSIDVHSFEEYIIAKPENEPLMKELFELYNKKMTLLKEYDNKKAEIVSKMNIETLEDYFNKLNNH